MRPRKGWRDPPNTPAHVSQRSQERGIGHRENDPKLLKLDGRILLYVSKELKTPSKTNPESLICQPAKSQRQNFVSSEKEANVSHRFKGPP